ncbi:MAG: cupin domain-containing protein [Chloroflexi bacterium]|nr:cupin domain-containing protein [Chloroflexota bacterium]
MSQFITPLDHAQGRAEKPFKTTFFLSERLLVGLNTLLPGQAQPLHDHADQDKFYQVLAGEGLFTVGEESRSCGPGQLVLAPAGIVHGVQNEGTEPLSFLTVIAPAPG